MDNRSLIRIKTIGIGILVVSLLVSCTNRAVPPEVYYTAPTAQAPDEIKDLLLESSIEDKDGVESSVNDSTEELFIPDEYFEVIDSIVLYIDNYDPEGTNSYYGNEYGSGVFDFMSCENPKDLVGFAFVDIDDDNVAELAILDCGYCGNLRITDFYAYYDGKVELVFGGGVRARYYLTKDMLFYFEGSGGASDNCLLWLRYDVESHDLSLLEGYDTEPVNVGMEDEGVVLYHTFDKTPNVYDDDSFEVEEMGTYILETLDLYGEYGLQEDDFYAYDNISTLTEYCESK